MAASDDDEFDEDFKPQSRAVKSEKSKKPNKKIARARIRSDSFIASRSLIKKKRINNKIDNFTSKKTKEQKLILPSIRKGSKNRRFSENETHKESILESSKKAWETYKKVEKIEEELANKNKDGFIEREEFLKKVEIKEWQAKINLDEEIRNQNIG
ncbi:hypothetical protein HZS_1100 [Henneguya salminicola]|nr:hypothetical protein HZS_1100 [Henneguya salminicola]